MLQELVPFTRSPMEEFDAQLLKRGDHLFVVIREPDGNIWIDILVERTGQELLLGSGMRQERSSTLYDSSGGLPYGTAPGTSLLEAAISCWFPTVWELVVKRPPYLLPAYCIKSMLERLFDLAREGKVRILGKELPFKANAFYIPFDPSSFPLWIFDLVREEARPRGGMPASSLVQIRVEEIADCAAEHPHALPRLKPIITSLNEKFLSEVKKLYAAYTGDYPDASEAEVIAAIKKFLPEITREMVRTLRRSQDRQLLKLGRKPGKADADIALRITNFRPYG